MTQCSRTELNTGEYKRILSSVFQYEKAYLSVHYPSRLSFLGGLLYLGSALFIWLIASVACWRVEQDSAGVGQVAIVTTQRQDWCVRRAYPEAALMFWCTGPQRMSKTFRLQPSIKWIPLRFFLCSEKCLGTKLLWAARCVEFSILYSWYRRALNLGVKEFIVAGHIDRVSLWIEELSHAFSVPVGFVQHGALEFKPNWKKLSFDSITCFNDVSIDFLVNRVLKSKPTHIRTYPVLDKTRFAQLPRGSELVVAFATQDVRPDRNHRIIHQLTQTLKDVISDWQLLVYVHPKESPHHYKRYAVDRRVRVETLVRHHNVDLFITRYSTMALEYRLLGVEILCLPDEEIDVCFLAGACAVPDDQVPALLVAALNRILG